MRLAFVTRSLDDLKLARELGYNGIEIRTTAFGDAVKSPLDPDLLQVAKQTAARLGSQITVLAHYRCAEFDSDIPLAPIEYTRVFDAAETLGIRTVATHAGFNPHRNWEGNIQFFAERFGPVAEIAEQRGIQVCFENWMGIKSKLPFIPLNLGGSPETWTQIFSAVPSRALGIEFDPSHLAWQGIDVLRALREFAARVYHVHLKDLEYLPEARYWSGINGRAYRFCLPGKGVTDWQAFFDVLREIGYAGDLAVEHEDEKTDWVEGLRMSSEYIRKLI
jgi:sugar phosphate isomerase/epimerase